LWIGAVGFVLIATTVNAGVAPLAVVRLVQDPY
jgi:hypothetical protein